MNIKSLEELLKLSKDDEDNKENLNENLKLICMKIDEREEFATEEIASATLKAYNDIVFNENLHPSAQDQYLCSIDRILDVIKRSEDANLKQVDTFILQLSQAQNSFMASVIEKIAICSIERKVEDLSLFDEDLKIDTSDPNRVALLVSALSKINDPNFLISTLRCYEMHPYVYRFDTLPIFQGTNKNGTLLAINILTSLPNGITLDEMPVEKLIELANSEDEYISIEKAVEENVALEGVRELKKDFPNLDMPYEEYYVKRPKEKTNNQTDDKNKSIVKENSKK